MFIGDAWYVAGWADEIRRSPVARRICNVPVVLFRDVHGVAAALIDSCCHRGAPLSLGSVTDAGLQCNYHGLVFAADGRCVEIPGQDMIPEKARVRSYPLVERHQLLWIWMGEPGKADPGLIPDCSYHDDTARWPHRHDVYHVKSNYLLLADNLMDLTHLGYVHVSTVGGDPRTHVEAKTDTEPTELGVRVTRWMPDSVPPTTYRKSVRLPERVDRWQEFEFVAPSSVIQWTGAVDVGRGAQDPKNREGGFSLRLFHSLTPETETTTHYFWSAANGYRLDDPKATDELFVDIAEAFREDKDFVEAQQARISEVGEDWLVNIRSDVARVGMRRALARMAKSSGPVQSNPF